MADYADRLQDELKDAMRNKNAEKRDTIRLLQAELKQAEVDTQKELSAEEELSILQKEAKKRRETIAELEEAGREEMAESERRELQLIETFLPEQLSRDEIAAVADEVIAEVGAESMQDMGQVMGRIMEKVKGRADGNAVSAVVREKLSK